LLFIRDFDTQMDCYREKRPMIVIHRQLVSSVSEGAKNSPRLRKNYNFHADYADPVNRMLNAFEPWTYVRPHKHESPDKCEVFVILTGKALALRFDDAGEIPDEGSPEAAAYLASILTKLGLAMD
jgi:cupin fold WbuC family metalloprotein